MRIGELLLARGALSGDELDRALEQQTRGGGRLCSILISRGALDFDAGARLLADQRGVPCALGKHLANRDPALAPAIPPELGRSACALPLGRTRAGMLIVAVRDPDHGLAATLSAAAGEDVMMVVTPATRLEHLIAATYGAGADDFDIDIDSAVEAETRGARAMPEPDIDLLDPDSIQFGLTDLDDSRVAKDPTQSGMFSLPGIMLPPPPLAVLAAGTQPRAPAVSLAETRQALQAADSRDAATALAMAFLSVRWRSAIVFAVRHATALGYRAHAATIAGDISRLAVPLSLPSTIERAVTSRQPSVLAPESEAQDQLARALGNPAAIAAAPVLVAEQVVAVIAVGGDGDRELAELAASLGEAYQRTRHA